MKRILIFSITICLLSIYSLANNLYTYVIINTNGDKLISYDGGANWIKSNNIHNANSHRLIIFRSDKVKTLSFDNGKTWIKTNFNSKFELIKSSKEQFYFSIFPNPVVDFCIIKAENNRKISNISIFDLFGHQIINLSINNLNKFSIDMHKLPCENYFLKLTDTKGNISIQQISKY